MAELFQRDKSMISRHIKNTFSEGKLVRESVCLAAGRHHPADDRSILRHGIPP